MKQVLQNIRTGRTEVAEVPAPTVRPGHVLIQTRASLISSGSERMIVEFGKGSLIAKARSQPEKVRQVLDKMKTDGLVPTLEVVFSKLDEPMPLGYSSAGVVLAVGPGVTEFAPGDRVASNGPHAEIVCVPKNLCARIPEGVTDEQAAFTAVSSVGLQGIRLLAPTLGEKFVVYGLGLIGLVSVQLLRAHGCEVLGIDISEDRMRLAERGGARTAHADADPVVAAQSWTGGRGVDGVLIAAAAQTDEIMHASAQMCRKRARIVLVGVVGLNLRRGDFYEKELSFRVSCSYGPGRYDDRYEEGGQDYPYGLVRWTEHRNFEAILEMMRTGRLDIRDLVSRRFPHAEAAKAYDALSGGGEALGLLLEYPGAASRATKVSLASAPAPVGGRPVLGIIGAGGFSKVRLLPSLKKTPARIAYVADIAAPSAHYLAAKFGADHAVTDYRDILADKGVDAVIIAVGHHLHARMVCDALAAGKHVFVEKPLAMNPEELRQVTAAAAAHPDRLVMVGFNRRFSPHIVKAKQVLASRQEPLAMTMTINAGIVPPEHWVQDPARGGGRIIGEACHFIDLMVHLAGSRVKTVAATMVGPGVATRTDKMAIGLGLEDGSIAAVNYFANGSRRYPKEVLEVFSEGRTLRLENFRRLVGYGFKGFSKVWTWSQDKGHRAEFAALVAWLTCGGPPPIPLADLVNVTLASFAAMTSAAENRTILLATEYAGALDGPPQRA